MATRAALEVGKCSPRDAQVSYWATIGRLERIKEKLLDAGMWLYIELPKGRRSQVSRESVILQSLFLLFLCSSEGHRSYI